MELARLSTGQTLGAVLDVDGTLYHHCLVRAAMALRFLGLGIIHPGQTLREARIIGRYRRAQESLRNHSLPGSGDPQLLELVSQTGLDAEQLHTVIDKWIPRAPLPWVALARRRGLLQRLRAWRELGVPMAVYSDYPSTEKLHRCGLDFLDDRCLCSTDPDIRSFKPGTRGFLAAARLLGLPPSKVVYIGDRPSVDAAGALAAGMDWVILPALGRQWVKHRVRTEEVLRELDQRFAAAYGKAR